MQAQTENKNKKKGKVKLEHNPMEQARFEKLVLHATTSDKSLLDKYVKLLGLITGKKVTFTKARMRIQAFKIRPGLQIGCKVTLRGKDGIELAERLFKTIGNTLSERKIHEGSISFGIKEYIEIPGVDYQRELGILGFDVTIVLSKSGKRVRIRKLKQSRIGKRQKINKQETIDFLRNKFNITIR